ncbi:MAG: bifunctional riboflavin kinase/FAD synthetase [Bacteroidales bacterium]|nr:bifunctional riboflavin kinase/FAD synthetase [Bacteroidales bacterium]
MKKPVVTIGIFDGVHLGHRFILDHLVKRAGELKGESVVVTLWPHPRIVLERDVWNFKLLHTFEEKIEQLSNLGIDHLIKVPFNTDLSSLPACRFLKEYLVDRLRLHTLLLGYDNRFGKDRQGHPDSLTDCKATQRFHIEKLPEYQPELGRINSTVIRKHLQEGNLPLAREMLGYDYYLTGTVVAGKRLGRDIGFPTANIHPTDPYKLIPRDGVYAVFVKVGGKRYRGMLNIGIRPTIDSAFPVQTIEVHILDFEGNLYDKTLTICFIGRIRDEMRFSTLGDLKKQLQADKGMIIDLLDHADNNKL